MRECGDCRACCQGWLRIENETIHASPGEPCKYMVDNGCKIYSERPEDPCRVFNCGWLIDEASFPEWMKPSNAKAIVVINGVHWQGYTFDLVAPVGKRVPPRTLNWLSERANKLGRPFIYSEHVVENKVYIGAHTKVFAQQPLRDNLIQWLNAGNRLTTKI